MTMKTTTIKIATANNQHVGYVERTCCAESAGPLSVHPTIGDPKHWTVTHNASGMAFRKDCRTRAQARNLAQDVKRACDAWGLDLDQLTSIRWPAEVLNKSRFAYLGELSRSGYAGVVAAEVVSGPIPA